MGRSSDMPESYPVGPSSPPSSSYVGRIWWLAAAGAGELAFLTLAGWWPGATFPVPGLLLLGGACGCWAAAAWALRGVKGSSGEGGARDRDGSETKKAPSRRALAAVWGLGVAVRLVLVPVAPSLSDDVYRYLWDGWVQLHGVNPYLYAPADPALTALHTSWHGLINHPDVPTIYPPAAQYAFLCVALLGATIPVAKVVWILFDLGTAWLLYRIARRSGRQPLLTLVLYLWCPLLVVETAWSGHLEPLGLFWVALFLLLAGRASADAREPAGTASPTGRVRGGIRSVGAGFALALATLTKFAPAAALPPLARRLGLRFGAVVVLGVLVAYLPYVGAGPALFTGLATYAEHWRFNEGAFVVLTWAFPAGRPPRWAAGALVLVVVGWATLRSWDPERSLFWVLGAGVALSPTVHPWYVLWLLPFAALRKSRAWLLLCGLVFLGYWGLGAYQETGSWPEPVWARLCIWLPFGSLLLYDALRAGRAPGPRDSTEPEGQIA